jgi:vacuolar protein sorting-associated protein 35
MQYLEQFFKEEYRRGRKILHLYNSVQQASNIIPRLYLLITAGSVYIESMETAAKDILFDLLQMVKGVQNPLRGLFMRYFLLKMIKDKLPDKDTPYDGSGGNLDDTLKFIIQNLEEMNRLWIRLSMGCTGNEKLMREKERNELKVLVGENIIRLSSLNGLSLEIYKENVLPKVVNILLESKDALSQQYLMECIIHAFPDDYNIHCMGIILETCTKLLQTVDIKSLFINLMEKLSKFVVRPGENNSSETLKAAEGVFDLLKVNIDKIINEQSSGFDQIKLLELQVAFLKFTVKCSNHKIERVNHILTSALTIISTSSSVNKMSNESIKLISKLLTFPLETLSLAIFEMKQYPSLMAYLDFSNRKHLALKIIESLVNTTSKEKLSSIQKISTLVDFIQPLLVDGKDSIDSDPMDFEYEQQTVAKLVFLVCNPDPTQLSEIYKFLKTTYAKGGNKRMKFTVPSLINAFLLLLSKVGMAFQRNQLKIEAQNQNALEFVNISLPFESEGDVTNFLIKSYDVIQELINLISSSYPETALKLNLSVIYSVNGIKFNRQEFENLADAISTQTMKIFNEEITDADTKLSSMSLIIGTLCSCTILGKDNVDKISKSLVTFSTKMVKRSDQCIGVLTCSNLYWSNESIRDTSKVLDCLNKAIKFAEFAMSNAQNLILLVHILNKFIFYIEKGTGIVSTSMIEDILEKFSNHLETIKNENNGANASFIVEIEKYYSNTISIIKSRKSSGKDKVFTDLTI